MPDLRKICFVGNSKQAGFKMTNRLSTVVEEVKMITIGESPWYGSSEVWKDGFDHCWFLLKLTKAKIRKQNEIKMMLVDKGDNIDHN